MIDAKQFRIGNLVYQDLNLREVNHLNQYGGYGGSRINGLPEEDFEPIELNPDWLRKLGFEVDIYDDDDDDAALVTLTGVFSMVPFYQKTRLLNISHAPKARKLKYVHELQNYIQVLTGEELTIKTN